MRNCSLTENKQASPRVDQIHILAHLFQITCPYRLERLIQPIGLLHKLALHLTSSTQGCSEVMKRLVFLV